MAEITENGKKVLKLLFTDFLTSYNANSMKEKISLSDVGSLKLLRNMEKKGFLKGERLGKAIFYRVNIETPYVLKLLELIFIDHRNLSPFIKGWIADLRTFIPLTEGIFLFGSLLRKEKAANDADVCFILKEPEGYKAIQSQINAINRKSSLPIHPLYLTEKEFEKRLKEKDKPLFDMVRKCIVVHGEGLFVRVLKDVQS